MALPTPSDGAGPGMFGVHGSGDTSGYGGIVRPVAMPGGTPRPYGGWFDELATSFESALATAGFTDAIEKVVVHRGEITFFIRRHDLLSVGRPWPVGEPAALGHLSASVHLALMGFRTPLAGPRLTFHDLPPRRCAM